MSDTELYSGMIRLHILHHAARGPVFGMWIIEELGRHDYKLSVHFKTKAQRHRGKKGKWIKL